MNNWWVQGGCIRAADSVGNALDKMHAASLEEMCTWISTTALAVCVGCEPLLGSRFLALWHWREDTGGEAAGGIAFGEPAIAAKQPRIMYKVGRINS